MRVDLCVNSKSFPHIKLLLISGVSVVKSTTFPLIKVLLVSQRLIKGDNYDVLIVISPRSNTRSNNHSTHKKKKKQKGFFYEKET